MTQKYRKERFIVLKYWQQYINQTHNIICMQILLKITSRMSRCFAFPEANHSLQRDYIPLFPLIPFEHLSLNYLLFYANDTKQLLFQGLDDKLLHQTHKSDDLCPHSGRMTLSLPLHTSTQAGPYWINATLLNMLTSLYLSSVEW